MLFLNVLLFAATRRICHKNKIILIKNHIYLLVDVITLLITTNSSKSDILSQKMAEQMRMSFDARKWEENNRGTQERNGVLGGTLTETNWNSG